MTAHDGSSFRGCFCSCLAAHLCRDAPAEEGHRRRAEANAQNGARLLASAVDEQRQFRLEEFWQ